MPKVQNVSRPRSSMSNTRNTVASREAGTLSAPDDDDEEWDRIINQDKVYHNISRERLISGAHSQSASHLKSLSPTSQLHVDTMLLQQNRDGTSNSIGLPQHSDRDKNLCYHRDHFNYLPTQIENPDFVPTYPDETSNFGEGQYQPYNASLQPSKQQSGKIQYLGKGVKSPLPTNNLPPHKQHKLYKKHMASSSSTPPLNSRGSKDSIVIVHPQSKRKFSNTSSLEDTTDLKANVSTDTQKDPENNTPPAQQPDDISVSNEAQVYDVGPHLISSNVSSSGAPPPFWADSSCHEDDPPSQVSGMNMNPSLASTASGGNVEEMDPVPPPVPPHGRRGITPPLSTSVPEGSNPLSGQFAASRGDNGVRRAHFKSTGDRMEDDDASSPDYTSLSTSSVDRMREQIPKPPPPPKLYYKMRSDLASRVAASNLDGSKNPMSGGGRQRQYKQQQSVYYEQQQQRLPYHRAKEFIANPSTQEMRYTPSEVEQQRSVQSQIGGGGWQHPKNTKGSTAYKGAKHNSERYLIQATDGSRANIQQSVGNNTARKRHINMQNTAFRARYMSDDSEL